jgi:hypothetical protein
MIEMFNNPLKISIIVYLFAFTLLYIMKPTLMFTKNNKIREFGTSNNKTILPIWLVSAIVGILTYNISTLVKNFLKPLYNKIVMNQLNIDMKCE